MSSSEPVVHFGLGQFLKAKKVSIYWPSGQIQILENMPAGYCIQFQNKATLVRKIEEINLCSPRAKVH